MTKRNINSKYKISLEFNVILLSVSDSKSSDAKLIEQAGDHIVNDLIQVHMEDQNALFKQLDFEVVEGKVLNIEKDLDING